MRVKFWLTILLPFSLGYFITTTYRSLNAILVGPIMLSLGLNSLEIGWVTATFALAVALAQLPLGVFLDHFGARKTQSVFFVIGGTGTILFGLATNVWGLALGRALLGVGMAGGLLAAFKAIAEWVDRESIPFYDGIVLGAGGLGALIATTPSKLFVVHFGWRTLCILLGIVTYSIALLIFAVSRDRWAKREHTTLWGQIRGMREVVKSRYFWQITPLFMVSFGGFIAMQGLWLGPWLEQVVGLSPIESANRLLVVAIGMTLGMLSGGLFAAIARTLRVSLTSVVVAGIVVHITTQLVIVSNRLGANILVWLIYSYFAQVTLVNYALLTQRFGVALSGRATTEANILVFLFAFAAQSLFGLVVHVYSGTFGYRLAFLLLIALECFALLWFFIARRAAREEKLDGQVREDKDSS